MVPLFLLILVTISKSENKKSARSLRFIDCPETIVTKSCLRNVRSVAAKWISPSIKDSICSSSILSFSVQLIFTAISCTCFCDSISDSWSGCVGSVCFNKVLTKQNKNLIVINMNRFLYVVFKPWCIQAGKLNNVSINQKGKIELGFNLYIMHLSVH